jgi:hypothetical protein
MNTKKISELFLEGKVSKADPDIDKMFYMSHGEEEFDITKTDYIDGKYMVIYEQLPKELKILYSHIGDSKEYTHKCGWIFKSLSNITTETYEHFIDIAYSYAGLGHVNVLAYHPESKKYFTRMDGGSNGYDREENYKAYKSYKPTHEELVTFQESMI